MFRKIAQPFYTAYVLFIFWATLFLVLPFYFLFSHPNTAKSKKMIWQLTRLWSKTWLRLTGLRVSINGTVPKGEKYVVIANHVSYLDPIVIYDVLPFFFRPLAKHELSKIPILGFIYAQIAILVDRSSAAKRARSMLQMQQALQNESSIFIYPEGTFNETQEPLKKFYDGAFRLAIETQTALLPIIFPDTHQRWNNSAWWKLWPGENRAFVLQAIPVEGLSLADLEMLKESVRTTMTAKIKDIHYYS